MERGVKRGILEPVDAAACAFPTVNVVKPSGEIRICGDFKPLNRFLAVDQYPIPHPMDLFSALTGGQKFSKLDLSDACNQLRVDEQSQRYLVINTHRGLFKYKRLPFGISPAPSLFQRIMDKILHNLKGTVFYLDDILVTGANDDEHLRNLSAVLQRLQQYGLRIKVEKCEFFAESVKYLGHTIDRNGVTASEDKIKAVQLMRSPQNQSELRTFLSMVNYFNQFFPKLSEYTAPLNTLLKKDVAWQWSPTAQAVFDKLKNTFVSLPVLAKYDPDLPVGLACDASEKGIGACIFHVTEDGKERPIEYA